MKEVNGNLIEMAANGEFELIAHGCNCHCQMGAGIAAVIRKQWPEAYEADKQTEAGDREKLGTCSTAVVDAGGKELCIVNAYTQYDYSGYGVLVDYDAVRSCMRWIKEKHSGKKIGLPKIGAGLAGGNWDTIAEIISQELSGEDLSIVIFEK